MYAPDGNRVTKEAYDELVRAGVSDDQLEKTRERMRPKAIEVLEANFLTIQVFSLLDLKLNMGFGGALYEGTDKSQAIAVMQTYTKDDKIIRDTLIRLKILESEACKFLNQKMSRKRRGN